jgi:hypothetical protein
LLTALILLFEFFTAMIDLLIWVHSYLLLLRP